MDERSLHQELHQVSQLLEDLLAGEDRERQHDHRCQRRQDHLDHVLRGEAQRRVFILLTLSMI